MARVNKRTEEFMRFFENACGVKFVDEDTGEEILKDANSTDNSD